MGLLYPIDSSTPPFPGNVSGVYVYAHETAGHADRVSFRPVPYAHADNCAPKPAVLPATGTLSLDS